MLCSIQHYYRDVNNVITLDVWVADNLPTAKRVARRLALIDGTFSAVVMSRTRERIYVRRGNEMFTDSGYRAPYRNGA